MATVRTTLEYVNPQIVLVPVRFADNTTSSRQATTDFRNRPHIVFAIMIKKPYRQRQETCWGQSGEISPDDENYFNEFLRLRRSLAFSFPLEGASASLNEQLHLAGRQKKRPHAKIFRRGGCSRTGSAA